MEKLKLELESLRVDSFDTVRPTLELRGTVRANEGSVYTYDYYQATCGGVSCQYVCRTRYDTPCV